MFSLLINATKYFLGTTECKDFNYDDFISKSEDFEHDANANCHDLSEPEKSESEEGCFYRDGIITSITADTVLIDDRHSCDSINCPMNLDVGMKVHYLAFQKDTNKDLQVRRIISINDDIWSRDDNETTNIVKKRQMLKKSLVAKVVKREGRNIFLEPASITLNLDKIDSTFVPYVGDWLRLESLVELDEESGDLGGEVLEVDKIQPLRSKLRTGTVTKYDPISGTGSFEKDTVFNKISCQPGYIPCVGDKVVYDSIESDQGIYIWRCITVVPLVQVVQEQQSLRLQPLIVGSTQMSRAELDSLLKDKCGICISDNLSFNLELRHAGTLNVLVSNSEKVDQTIIKGIFMTKKSQSQLSLVSPHVDAQIIIKPGQSKMYVFKCNAKFIGSSEEIFIFNFKGFSIGRSFNISISLNSANLSSTISTVNYIQDKMARQDNFDQGTYIPGIRPYKPPNFVTVRSGTFRVPQRYWNIVLSCVNEKLSQLESEGIVGHEFPFLYDGLTFKNYKDRFHALLYLEEISLTIDLQRYDMESGIMYHSGEYLVLEVPGLAEKRPSLIVGDRAIVSFKWDASQGKLKNEGFIHKVKNSEVYLKFNPRFHDTYNSEDCQITFKCSYSSIGRCHNAVNLAISNLGSEILFPTFVPEKEPQIDLYEQKTTVSAAEMKLSSSAEENSSTKGSYELQGLLSKLNSKEKEEILNEKSYNPNDPYTQLKKRKLIWYNKQLNYYQKKAVRNILLGVSRPLPYVIFGPPGTGKTITLCEAILQIITTIPESRILIATPSNSSANLIAERLLDSEVLKPGDLVRLVARHCLDGDSIPEKLLPYCATANLAEEGTSKRTEYYGEGPKMNCTMSVLGRHRITVGTCIALGLLYNMGFPKGHFTHIIADEAGQATEPELMVPLSLIHVNVGQIILAGDPMQLGPFVNSKLAKYFGFGESFLVRLLHQFPYQRDPEGFETGYDPRLVTKLLINYRSLPEILKLPNSMFYGSELQAYVSATDSPEAELLKSIAEELPSRVGEPPAMVFHGLVGDDCQDPDSPSWYNPAEAAQVYSYLLKLYDENFTESDIGIIAPYKKQVSQIRKLLWELDMLLPKVGSVEEFQGQERKIIIISTVRSNTNYVGDDIKHALGFVSSPRRLNVALTRARALVIIIGNPYLLSQDPYWRNVLVYCINNHSYTGCNYSLDVNNDNKEEEEEE